MTFSKSLLEKAFDFFRNAGVKGYEAVVLFAGEDQGYNFEIKELYIPYQTSYKGPDGLLYHVEHSELLKLYDWLYEKGLHLYCQMHTHPTKAYHSSTDDRNCIVTALGGISIVIPNFARGPIDTNQWAVYTLVKNNGWTDIKIHSPNFKIKLV